MEMSRMYTDFVNKTALTVPDKFIDVKTGESFSVPAIVEEQIEYHANNNTLIHLILSALHQYLHPKAVNGSNAQILLELSEIKRMMQQGYVPNNHLLFNSSENNVRKSTATPDITELEDVLDAFGG